jgi:hypothetical protein
MTPGRRPSLRRRPLPRTMAARDEGLAGHDEEPRRITR